MNALSIPAAFRPSAARPVEVPAPPPDQVPLPPAPHPAPPGPEPVPPEIDEPPGVGDPPVENPGPAPQPIQARATAARPTPADRYFLQHRWAELLWNQPSQLYALLSRDGTVRLANRAWQSVLGHDPASLVGRRLDDLVHQDDATPLAMPPRSGTAADGPAVSRWRHADGSLRTLAWFCFGDAADQAFSGRPLDADAVAPAPRAPTDSAIAQAQRLRAVARVCGGVSQEFNNLLQSLHHSLELIRRHCADERQVQQLCERALTTATSGRRMTAQLLEFVGLQRGPLRPVQLSGLLALRGELQRQLGSAIRIEMSGFEDAGWILSEPERLRNALTRLAVNGGEAMPDGGTLALRCERITIERDAELPTGAYVQIGVSDEGPGIGEAIRASAIEPFFTTKPVGEGLGLGLSQVYGFARYCGGTLRLDAATRSCGTTVRLLLPAAAQAG